MKVINSGFLATLLFTLGACLTSYAQSNDPVVLNINNDRKVTLSEFEYVYKKNNMNPNVMDSKSVDEYMDLFINFNLKVYEALQLGLDTNQSFIDELEGYKEQLAEPYLTDQQVTEQLLQEALERSQYDIRASHILVNVDEHAAPGDTLIAWNRIMELRNMVIEEGDFESVAEKFSDDPSAKGSKGTANRPPRMGNKGDLGYFTVFNMVYPFETAAYNTPVGEISMPVRSQFGYHIIKVTDKLPAMGEAKVAHIMASIPPGSSDEKKQEAEQRIKELHKRILEGESFEELAERFSDDKTSGKRGGELPRFTSNRMVPDFIKIVSNLEEKGDISEPFTTPYGWHIMKLDFKNPPVQDEEYIADIKKRIKRDSRSALSKNAVLKKLKKNYNFRQNRDLLDILYNKVDSTIFQAKWKPGEELLNNNDILFSFADQNITLSDFAKHLENGQSMRSPESVTSYVNAMYQEHIKQKVFDYEKKMLPQKHTEFKQILKEYHDGILLFELTNQMVWNKAMEDTIGLKNFYENNIDNYYWNDRIDAVVYTFNSKKEAKSGRKTIKKALKDTLTYKDLLENFNKESQTNVSAEAELFEITDDSIWENVNPEKQVSKVMNVDGTYKVVQINEFIPSQPKKLSEIRGLVIADYQNFLEKQWIQELKEKYTFTVYQEVLNTIKE